MIRVFIL